MPQNKAVEQPQALKKEISDSFRLAEREHAAEKLAGNVVKQEYWKGELAVLHRIEQILALSLPKPSEERLEEIAKGAVSKLDDASGVWGAGQHSNRSTAKDRAYNIILSALREASSLPGKVRLGGICETTMTKRLRVIDCVCPTYEANLGPCATFKAGSNGRCAYCDHTEQCHEASSLPEQGGGK